MMEKFIILGAGGQVARAWTELLGEQALSFSQDEIDLAKPDFIQTLETKIGSTPIAAVINTAAYTAVDKAENEEKLAMRINAEAVGELATWGKEKDVPFVHYSTDYVFNGSGVNPRKESTPPAPLNVYGKSKLAGEQAIEGAGGKSLIFRTSWVYNVEGHNFVNTMLRLFTEKEEIAVVDDQVGAPTYALHLADALYAALIKALEIRNFPSGVYHLCGSGETSWHGFASAIFALATKHVSGIRCVRINKVATADYPTPAKRPLNSRLDCSKAYRTFAVALPTWEEGIREYFENKYENRNLQHRRPQTHTS